MHTLLFIPRSIQIFGLDVGLTGSVVPRPMDTVIRIFAVISPYTAKIRRDTARFCAVFHRNPW